MEHEIFLRNCGLGLPCDFETPEGRAIYGRCNEPPLFSCLRGEKIGLLCLRKVLQRNTADEITRSIAMEVY